MILGKHEDKPDAATHTLRKKCPYLEFFWSLHIQSECGKCGPEKLRIQTLFTQ